MKRSGMKNAGFHKGQNQVPGLAMHGEKCSCIPYELALEWQKKQEECQQWQAMDDAQEKATNKQGPLAKKRPASAKKKAMKKKATNKQGKQAKAIEKVNAKKPNDEKAKKQALNWLKKQAAEAKKKAREEQKAKKWALKRGQEDF